MDTDRQTAFGMLWPPASFPNKVLLAPSHTPFVPGLWQLLGPLQSNFTKSKLAQSRHVGGEMTRGWPGLVSCHQLTLLQPVPVSKPQHPSTAPADQHVRDVLCLSDTQEGPHMHICQTLSPKPPVLTPLYYNMVPCWAHSGHPRGGDTLKGRTQFL